LSEEPTRILLVRHASTDYVEAGRLAGRSPGIRLNERGRAQALAVAERLASLPIAAVYSSPLERAIETAGPIAELHRIPVCSLEGLVETNCGEWTGCLIEELGRTDQWRWMQAAPSCTRHPGGESMAEVQARMVSHGDPIRLLLAFHTGLHLDMFQRLAIDPASISELEFGSLRPRLLRCNDRAHLRAFDGEEM
jgi:broad specificity phosphatase PhoE